MTHKHQTDILLPAGWTWERVEAERARWGIAPNMVPIVAIPGAAVAWGTINSVRKERVTTITRIYLRHYRDNDQRTLYVDYADGSRLECEAEEATKSAFMRAKLDQAKRAGLELEYETW